LLLKKIRNLSNRKARNIFEFKIDKIIADTAEGIILLEILNSLSPRFFFFINLIVGKGFTNLFFRFLDFSGKSVEVP
jgi:hypothetical protein